MADIAGETVKVTVRCRGLNATEEAAGAAYALNIHPETHQVEAGKKHFTYDSVLGSDSSQEDVYTNGVQPLVGAFLSGLNASILAYGQTGAGKTYTMGSNFVDTRSAKDRKALGVIPRVVEEVLEAVDGQRGESICRLEVSFLEVYNEHVRDLLRPSDVPEPRKGYQFQKDAFGNYDVRGLTHVPLTSLEDLASILRLGGSRRTTASTNMNATSSRSHAIFSMRLEQTPILAPDDDADADEAGAALASASCLPASAAGAAEGEGPAASPAATPGGLGSGLGIKRVSVFRLVDLAGSERAKKTGAEGDRLREANSINQSLVTLGRCINALASRAKHVPFRQSKLTQLLTNSLGGNSATLMIACVSPADSNFEESCMTLEYAQRAASIENKPVVNADPAAASAVHLRHANQELRNELARLYAGGAPVDPEVLSAHGIVGGAAASPCPLRRGAASGYGGGLSRSLAAASVARMLPVGAVGSALSAAAAAHSTAQGMRQREEAAAATVDLARMQDELEGLRRELGEANSRGQWAVEQARALLDENTQLSSDRDSWRWRFDTLSSAFAKLEGVKTGTQTPEEAVAAALRVAGDEAMARAVSEANTRIAALRGDPTTPTLGTEESKASQEEDEAGAGEAVGEDEEEDSDEGSDEDDNEDEDSDEEVPAAAKSSGPTEHDVHHIRAQMELRGQLQQVSEVLRQKQSLLHAMSAANGAVAGPESSVSDRFERLKADFQQEMQRSEAEVEAMEETMKGLAAELESTKREAERARSEGEREAKAQAASTKDGELRALRAKVSQLQSGMREASRAQKRRDRELARIQALQSQIESHKREKVKLEKVMRDAGKKYLEEKRAHQRDQAQAAKRERAQALALHKYRQEIERQGRALEAAKQRVRTMKRQDDAAKSRKSSARAQREASRAAGARRGRGTAGRGSGAEDPAVAALATAADAATASPGVHLPLRAGSAKPGSAAWRAALAKDAGSDLLTATGGLQGGAAALIERAAAEAAGAPQPAGSGGALEESLELGDDGQGVWTVDVPRGVDEHSRLLVRRALFYRVQAAGWRCVAEAAVERRAAAASELHALRTGASGRSRTAARSGSSSSAAAAAAAANAGAPASPWSRAGMGKMSDAERRRAESLRRDMVSLTLRVQHAQAQMQAFHAVAEGEGLAGSGWIARAAEETTLRGSAKHALAGRMLSWLLAELVAAQTAIHAAGGAGVAAEAAASAPGRERHAAASSAAAKAAVAEAVSKAQRELQQELWRVQCEAAAAQKEDAEKVLALQAELLRAQVEGAKAASRFAEEAHEGVGESGSQEEAEFALAGGSSSAAAASSRPLLAENRRLRRVIAEMEAMLGSYVSRAETAADAARSESDEMSELVELNRALEQQLSAERQRVDTAKKQPRHLSILSTAATGSSPAAATAAAARRAPGEVSDGLPSLGEISTHLQLADIEEDDNEDDDSTPASSTGASPQPAVRGPPTTLQALILTTSERRASLVGGGAASAGPLLSVEKPTAAALDPHSGKRLRDAARSGSRAPMVASSSSPAESSAATRVGAEQSSPAASAPAPEAAPAVGEAAGASPAAEGKRPRVSAGARAAISEDGPIAAADGTSSARVHEHEDVDSDSDGDDSEFAGQGTGFDAAMSSRGAGTAATGASLIRVAAAQQAAEGKAIRSRLSKYVAPRGFGSSTARDAPDHAQRVEERRRDALETATAAGGSSSSASSSSTADGAAAAAASQAVVPARVTVTLAGSSSAQPPRPPTEGDEDAAARLAKARLHQFMADKRPPRRRSSVGVGAEGAALLTSDALPPRAGKAVLLPPALPAQASDENATAGVAGPGKTAGGRRSARSALTTSKQ